MDIGFGQNFNTDIFFSGGAGMFIEYHDIVKPTYLYATLSMLFSGIDYNLPMNIINDMSIMSLIEWYMNRRYRNPLRCLDYMNAYSEEELDKLLSDVLSSDPSIYRLAPPLNVNRLLSIYKRQHMSFPIFIYSADDEPSISSDIKETFRGLPVKYLHGDLETAVKKCDENFTFMVSDIELLKSLAGILKGTCSHLTLSYDYRYNFIDNRRTLKHDLDIMQQDHPFIRIDLNNAVDLNDILMYLSHQLLQEEDVNATSNST